MYPPYDVENMGWPHLSSGTAHMDFGFNVPPLLSPAQPLFMASALDLAVVSRSVLALVFQVSVLVLGYVHTGMPSCRHD